MKVRVNTIEYETVERVYQYTVEVDDTDIESFTDELEQKEGSDDIYDFLNNYKYKLDSDYIEQTIDCIRGNSEVYIDRYETKQINNKEESNGID